jgi:hypothetical protein
MSNYDDTEYIMTKAKNGQKFLCPINSDRLCPINSDRGHLDHSVDLNDDCIEEDVVRRYSGNINVKS